MGARVDWERHSLFVNIGNTHSRSGDYTSANEQFKIAENLGNDHFGKEQGSERDGNMDEAKSLLKEVLEQQMKDNLEAEKKKAEEKEEASAKVAAANSKEAIAAN